MISKGSSPTAAQKRWHDWLASKGCWLSGDACEIHHVKGAKFKLKVNGITEMVGNWYVLPLSYEHHRDPTNQYNVTDWKKRFESKYGTQKRYFSEAYDLYIEENGEPPFSIDIFNAILKS